RSWSDPKGPIYRSNVIVVDDPQLCAITPEIRKMNPNCKVIYRSHIEVRADMTRIQGSPQHGVWEFLYQFIKAAHVFVSHPIANFVPDEVPRDQVVLMPASTDSLDGLNKPLHDWSMGYNRMIFNRVCWDQSGSMLGGGRPYIAGHQAHALKDPRADQCACADSAGIADVIQAYSLFRQMIKGKLTRMQTPQLVICGHGSVDDPDATLMYDDTMRRIQQIEFSDITEDICVARLPPSDQLLNAVLRGAHVALQLSRREGFEVKVTESLHKGVPVVAYATGGIPHQIEHGRTGFLVPMGDYGQVARHLVSLFTNQELYDNMSRCAEHEVNHDYFTASNLLSWLWLFNSLHEGEKPGGEIWVRDACKEWLDKQSCASD
ncbi:hypothetical protein THASP1DRAFT_24322, partial [Thamnocephalis sphaerospora]